MHDDLLLSEAAILPWVDNAEMGPFDSGQVGRLLLVAGILIAVLGVVLLVFGRLPFGRLPGDISGSHGGFSFHLLLGTSLVLSVVLTVILNLFLRR